MERKKKKTITLDGLAGLMEKGFKKQEKRTDGLVKTMNQFAVSVDKRFDKIETDICDIKEEVHKVRIEMRRV